MTARVQHTSASKPAKYVQLATIPWRRTDSGEVEVLLLTSRETARWVIPKGWPMKGKKPYQAAATEALEEAGVLGKIAKRAIGSFEYWKRRDRHFDLCTVKVYLMEFEQQLGDWRERGQRQTVWVPPARAAELVDEPGLTALFEALALNWSMPVAKSRRAKTGPRKLPKSC